MATTSAQVQQLYVAYLGRAADKAGLDYWLNELNAENATLTLDDLRSNFVNEQPEYTDAYAGLSRSDTVTKIYNNLFGRTPDAAGLAYWTTGGGASVNADQLLTAFINGAATADATVLNNKVLVSEVYTSTAGDNYAKADATSILSGVNGTSTSVAQAIAHLEDGSLSGIAIPAGLAALKAEALAEKAIVDFEASKVTELSDLNKAVVDLNVSSGKGVTLEALGTPAAGQDLAYADVDQAIDNAHTLRDAIGGSTTVLQAQASQAATDLAATRLAFTQAATGNVDKANAYEKALTAAAGLKVADQDAVTSETAKTNVDFTAAKNATGGTDALAKANADAGVNVTTAATLYTQLTDANKSAVQIKAITDAFDVFLAGSSDYTQLKALAATTYDKNVADAAVVTTGNAITGTGAAAYKQDITDKTTADKTLADAQAADALVAKADAITAAHTVLDDSASAVVIPSTVKDLGTDAATANADLFHFADGTVTTADFAIGTAGGGFAKGDALYIGEGYTLNTTAKYDASGAGALTGGQNGVKEVFFVKDAGVVKAVIETADLGSSTVNAASLAAGGSSADQVSVITLTGVTDVSQVSFSNGVITHVA